MLKTITVNIILRKMLEKVNQIIEKVIKKKEKKVNCTNQYMLHDKELST